MKMTFRWYGPNYSITLGDIRQIPGMTGVVTAVYDTPVGTVWSNESLYKIKKACDDAQLETEVIESVPVHEDIKLGKPSRDRLIENYKQNIINCGKAGVKCICYNFMPVFDWFRTNLYYKHSDGSTSLSYSEEDFKKLDKRNLRLPGWDESYTAEQLNGILEEYEGMTHEKLFENLENQNALEHIEDIIEICVSIKRDVVNRDEKEAGERKLLNFGHTLGHAIEKIYNFKGISHGMAVAIGMVLITKAGEKHGITEKGTADKICALCKKYGLPTTDKSTFEQMAQAAKGDKKTAGSSIDLVLLTKIGDSFTKKVELANLCDFITT